MSTEQPPPIAHELALAIVTASTAPLLLLDADMQILAVSESFHAGFDLPPAASVGQSIFKLDSGAWNLPRLRSALQASLTADTPMEPYELDLPSRAQGTRRLVLNASRLPYSDTSAPRILVSVSDVTDARIADRIREELARERTLLIQEVQHRVANSLQIIASVLMQSARKVQSEEVRRHLHEAHHRVMSIASVQDQLSVSGRGDVALRPYLTQLCDSIGASMIQDPVQTALGVRADDVSVTPDESVSLGLIVTELVINALKHAFPDNRSGQIAVDYAAQPGGWQLTVTDDGIGMPAPPETAPSGLGSSIVTALARQLKATVAVSNANPGTAVAITHAEPAADGSGPPALPAVVAI